MTPPKHGPFKLHFLPGLEDKRDVKAHQKREFGWIPNEMRVSRMKSQKKRKKK